MIRKQTGEDLKRMIGSSDNDIVVESRASACPAVMERGDCSCCIASPTTRTVVYQAIIGHNTNDPCFDRHALHMSALIYSQYIRKLHRYALQKVLSLESTDRANANVLMLCASSSRDENKNDDSLYTAHLACTPPRYLIQRGPLPSCRHGIEQEVK